jgi:glycosyltransferase involved in cell wall biosynthesis
MLAWSLSVPDVHLVCLKPDLEGLIVPSKFYGICAAGRPSLFVGDPDGEIARALRRGECGHSVATGDAAALAACVEALRADADACRAMGERARGLFEKSFDRRSRVLEWRSLFDAVGVGEVSGAAGRP